VLPAPTKETSPLWCQYFFASNQYMQGYTYTYIYIYIVFNNLFILYIIYVYRYIINRSYTHIHVYSKTYIILYSNFFLQEPSFVGCHQVPWIIRKMCSSSTPWEGDGWVPLVEGIVFFFLLGKLWMDKTYKYNIKIISYSLHLTTLW
jgi:hypothetical protein